MQRSQKVTLFIQCIIDGIYPEVGFAVVRIFEKLGIEVKCPAEQTCCGQPAFNSGYRKEAKRAAEHFIDVFGDAEVIVCPSGSCVNMVRNHYPELFRDDGKLLETVKATGSRTFELTEYLVDVLGVEDLGARYDGRITYHDSCHLMRGIGVKEQPRRLIRKISGAEFVEMNDSDRCCGFGGAFAVKYPEISSAILEDKVKNIIDSNAEVVTGCDMGCLMNIQGMLSRKNLPVKTLHIAQLLAG
ncbi:MAG: L-lactate dehydrogenase complex protein LldE [Thermodesulfobacteriota bacterium]|nr:L-lactate dehydrogenase complex protein LldE [Thermodesulfobacteriota bacterium]